MQTSEFIEKVNNASEMMFTIGEMGFTISEEENGVSIAMWNQPDTERLFADAESLIAEYIVDGKPLHDQMERIKITFFTGYFEE